MSVKILLPVALIAVGAALYGLSGSYFSQLQPQEETVEVEPEANQIEVHLVNRELVVGEAVSAEDFAPKMVDEKTALELGFSVEEPFIFEAGMVSRQGISADTWVKNDDFVTPEQDGYVELVIQDDYVPYPIKIDPNAIIGGLITHGSLVDIIALSSINQNLANESTVGTFQSVSISPVLMAVKVIKVDKNIIAATKNKAEITEVSLILELSRKDVAKLAIAKNIAQLEVHKSIGKQQAEQLHANSGDVLPDYRAIKEFRASELTVK